jgi:hypothetical protein
MLITSRIRGQLEGGFGDDFRQDQMWDSLTRGILHWQLTDKRVVIHLLQ